MEFYYNNYYWNLEKLKEDWSIRKINKEVNK